MQPLRVMVTGANGFVGQALCAEATRRGFRIRGATRSVCELPIGAEPVIVGEIDGETDWASALRSVDVVIHLAARVHVMKEAAVDPLAEFLKANLHGTANLAEQAVHAGVKRFVYVSSIKVNGECTFSPGHPPLIPLLNPLPQAGEEANEKGNLQSLGEKKRVFSELDEPRPQDPYAISKWQAEQALQRIAQETGLEIVIVRPPLVYGPGVKGNYAQMLDAVAQHVPLPFASVHNRRSLVYVGNLVDALITCATHPAAAGHTYLVCDGEDVSTPDLLRRLGAAMGHPARLFPCPPALLKLAGRLIGKPDQVERLLGSLRVDSGKIRRELNWIPPYALQHGLQETAEWYTDAHSQHFS